MKVKPKAIITTQIHMKTSIMFINNIIQQHEMKFREIKWFVLHVKVTINPGTMTIR